MPIDSSKYTFVRNTTITKINNDLISFKRSQEEVKMLKGDLEESQNFGKIQTAKYNNAMSRTKELELRVAEKDTLLNMCIKETNLRNNIYANEIKHLKNKNTVGQIKIGGVSLIILAAAFLILK